MTYPIAYQLYSSRNFPPLNAHLPILKDMGYDAIEPWLPAYEDSAHEFRQALDDAGLGCIGFHMPLDGLINEPYKYIDIAKTLGASYLIPPYIPVEERGDTADYWKSIGEHLAIGADKANAAGLNVAWHNHEFEFTYLADGSRPIDHILGVSRVVKFEIDIGWIVRAGADPASELVRFANQIVAIQVKDTAPIGTRVEDGWSATGDGIIDWPVLAKLFKDTNADHIVTEHDNPADWNKFARRSIEYIKQLGL